MPKKGKLTVVAGPMFSGKTGKLIGMTNVFTKMGHTVLTVKPSIDTRYSTKDELHSHDHQTTEALVVDPQQPNGLLEHILEKKPDDVIFDEVQFFDTEKIKTIIKTLKRKRIHVIASGLLYDYKRKPFGATADLLGLADERLELFSICQKCGSLARHTERRKGGKDRIVVGAADKYIAVCDHCHKIYR